MDLSLKSAYEVLYWLDGQNQQSAKIKAL